MAPENRNNNFTNSSQISGHQRAQSIKQQAKQTSITTLQPISTIHPIPEIPTSAMSQSLERGSLLKVKQTRQVMEKDEKLLENRIKMLHNEEQKLLKKIDMTRKQAEKILAIKQQNEEHHRQKIMMQMEQDSSIDQFKEQKRQEKEMSKQKFQDYTRSIYEDKRNAYISLKNTRLTGEQQKQQYLQTVIQQNQDRKQQIRQQEFIAKEKLNLHWNSKVERSQLNYLEKLDKQKNVLSEKAKNITKMEEMEAELLKKLQHTQLRHKETFSMLENVMKGQTVGVKTRLTQSVDSRSEMGEVNKQSKTDSSMNNGFQKKKY
ncbi:UNKNOWN [Stylonychia lemnae]|uniref:Uncharacterized protein n=1 Tax=Stylonychia lemnae TaxID=5949 RepID=A0A078BAD5_STYLE|nr:UNKNOWN [Stylonychia lemnae]|eukprot:CDW90483.1 UNKNOWN [Stylonychia lemnae]